MRHLLRLGLLLLYAEQFVLYLFVALQLCLECRNLLTLGGASLLVHAHALLNEVIYLLLYLLFLGQLCRRRGGGV